MTLAGHMAQYASFEKSGPWLRFTAEQPNSTIKLNKVGSPNSISLETSRDGSTWTDYNWTDITGDTLTLSNIGDKVYFRAKTENSTFSTSESNYYKFVGTGKFAASGNIQSLLKADCSRTDAPIHCFRNMFNGCSSLTTAPAFPATTLSNDCYESALFGCTSLTASPALPATTLASNCYGHMLKNCTSLTTAPALPATTLANYCYAGMFEGDISLTDAPKLPAQQLTNYCYHYMFNGCSSLSCVVTDLTAWKNISTNGWLQNVAATGVFMCPTALGTNETISRGANYCPTGWTVVNTDA